MNTYKISNFLIYNIFFISFIGFYSFIIFLHGIGFENQSQLISMIVRIVLLILVLLLLLFNMHDLRFSIQYISILFFTMLYQLRILIDYLSFEYFYMPFFDVFSYFFTFVFFPIFCLGVIKFKKEYVENAVSAFIFSSFIFSILSIIFFREYIGESYRILSLSQEGMSLSPLILSYCAALVIGVNIVIIRFNIISKKQKIISLASIFFSFLPFLIGSSRGSIFALLLPFIYLLFSFRGFYQTLQYILILLFIGMTFSYLSQNYDNDLINRLWATDNSNEIRLEIWKSSFNQFLQNPILGDKLENDFWHNYPHNLFIEVLQSTGILGFSSVLIALFFTIKTCNRIIKFHREFIWIAVIFFQSFTQSMFSGSIYNSSWLWLSFGLLLTIDNYFKKNKNVL